MFILRHTLSFDRSTVKREDPFEDLQGERFSLCKCRDVDRTEFLDRGQTTFENKRDGESVESIKARSLSIRVCVHTLGRVEDDHFE